MGSNRGEAKSRNSSGPKGIEGAGSEHRRDPSRGDSRRKFRDLNVDFVEILDEGIKAIREGFELVGIGRVQAEHTVLGSNWIGEGTRDGESNRTMIIIVGGSEEL